MSISIKEEIVEQLDKLPVGLQKRVLDFTQALILSMPKGLSGNDLKKFVGIISPEDAKAIEEAIEEGCEQVDLKELRWNVQKHTK
jgi:AAA+ superfamily predicted ATPase